MRLHAILLLMVSALLLAGCIGQKAAPPGTTLPPVSPEVPLDVEIEGLMPPTNAAEPELPVPAFGEEEGVDLGSVL
ncbi:MAG: hypothetical protein AABX40_09290 [Candidatus Hydrothermarchaeota archaeon]